MSTQQKQPKTLPPLYFSAYSTLVPVAREHGYALAIHGSVQRDGDFLAVAWTEDAVPPEELLFAFGAALGVKVHCIDGPTPHPHGRVSWVIVLMGTDGGYLDVSVIGPATNNL